MSWIRRLLGPKAYISDTAHNAPATPRTKPLPTVSFDPSTIKRAAWAVVRKEIQSLRVLTREQESELYELLLRNPADLHALCGLLMKSGSMSKQQATEIARKLSRKAVSLIGHERQVPLGITHAKWLYSNAACMVNPSKPSASDVERDAAHRVANGKIFEIKKGLYVNGEWTWPGIVDGCKCVQRSIIPGLEQ